MNPDVSHEARTAKLTAAWRAWMAAQRGDDGVAKDQTWCTFLTLVLHEDEPAEAE